MNDLDLRTALHRDADLVGEPAPDLLDQLAGRRRHQRRQRAGILAAAAAVVVISAGIPVVSSLTTSADTLPASRPTIASTPAVPTEAAPTTSEPAPTTSAKPAPAPATTDPEPPALVLGPDGLGPLKLGMTAEEADATGMLRPWDREVPDGTGCRPQFRLADDSTDASAIWASDDSGVRAIQVGEGVLTPEGIGIGSSAADMDAAYPGWRSTLVVNWRAYPPVAGNSDAVYRITVVDDKVTSLTIQYAYNGCYE
jgi:hypothetical protein